jgi:hypothetical protein
LPGPVDAIKRKLGNRSITARVIGVRSRITQMISKGGRRATTASGSATWSLKTVIAARPSSADQSAIESATFW